jgi:hypothetical protein
LKHVKRGWAATFSQHSLIRPGIRPQGGTPGTQQAAPAALGGDGKKAPLKGPVRCAIIRTVWSWPKLRSVVAAALLSQCTVSIAASGRHLIGPRGGTPHKPSALELCYTMQHLPARHDFLWGRRASPCLMPIWNVGVGENHGGPLGKSWWGGAYCVHGRWRGEGRLRRRGMAQQLHQ